MKWPTFAVHRDIKPTNILMLWDGPEVETFTAKISDFGISKKLDPGRNSKTTKNSKGTTGYIAPEISKAKIKKPVSFMI